jgi:uncharacterized protein YndB with AHSA1/START domain
MAGGDAHDAANDADRTLVLTRRFEAPREAVFAAWIDPASVARWIGPRSVKAEVLQMDARPGGTFRIAMHGASGLVNTVNGTYREVARPKRLVFTWAWEIGKPTQSAGHATLVTLTFRAVGTATEMTLHQAPFETKASRDDHDLGWAGSFDKLAEVLAGLPGRR